MHRADKNRAVHGFDFTPLLPHAQGWPGAGGEQFTDVTSTLASAGLTSSRWWSSQVRPLYPRIREADFAPLGEGRRSVPPPPHAQG